MTYNYQQAHLCIDYAAQQIEDLSKRRKDLCQVCVSLAGHTDLTGQVEGCSYVARE